MSATSFAAGLTRKLLPETLRPIGYLTHLTRSRCGCRVRSGPFLGIKYVDDSVGSAYIPKLLGIYERELGPAVEQACGIGFSLIVDVGAAEGYYAVGMAVRNPSAHVEAFEMDPAGRSALHEMVRLNGLEDRVTVKGECDPGSLQESLESRAGKKLVICDVEGYEDVLLDPAAVPALRGAWILVELHDWLKPGIAGALRDRFSPTHRVDHIWQEPRDPREYPFRTLGTGLLPRSYLEWAVSEWRPERMSWLWMEPTP